MFKKIFRLIVLLVVLYVGYTGYSIWTFEGEHPPEDTEAAVVLGAAAYYNKPSPVFEERIKQGIKLYEEGNVDKLIFTGGKGKGAEYAESEVAKMYAINNGVPEEDILIENTSGVTQENLENAYQIGQEQEIDTYTLVSDPLHMKRAILMAKQIGMEVKASPTETSAYQSLETKLPFFFKEWAYYMGYQGKSIVDNFH
ncbi:multidrug MFS transporter [Pontibacillus halophilus JSM 076056 = DSM 19796]|uniref:Multidrug MFS transporter n=1 Tax=Pontibacillus halophilus JSM 076056 = DSM 19796 TaxID=1385510 RepID=A0A0A5GLL1_9BACI|nr:YdcF family protein [Pontibacillus halophilus]KGX92889.1 multidrug MFS transporter [Pontibacillus halophilus JSM 076056 = DSM 19796]